MELSEALMDARRRRGWSRQKLALALPVDGSHLSRWEAGTRPVPLAAVVRAAVALNAPELLAAACAACPVGQCASRDGQEVA